MLQRHIDCNIAGNKLPMLLYNLAVAVQRLPVDSSAVEVLVVHIAVHTVPMPVEAVHMIAAEVVHIAVEEAAGHKHYTQGSPMAVVVAVADFAFQAVGLAD